MRLENYSAARFDEGEAVIDEPMAEAPPTAAAEPEPEAPSRLLSELARQPNAFTPPPAAPAEAATAAATTWQGMSLPSAVPSPAGAAPSPWPGVDAETFARIEAMGSRDTSAGGSRGSSFGSFGGGFGGIGGGGDTETWDYSFEGMDGAPDVTVSVTYQGDTPISSMTTTTLPDSGASVSPIAQEHISLPPTTGTIDLGADLPAVPSVNDAQTGNASADLPPQASTPPAATSASDLANATGTLQTGSAAGGSGSNPQATPSASEAVAATSASEAPSGAASIYPDRYRFVPGLAGKEPAGGRDGLSLARDLPPLASEFTPTTLDGRTGSGVPYRDQEGQVYYRTFDASGAEVGLISAPVEVNQLERVVVTGRRTPDAGAGGNPPQQGLTLATAGATLPLAARLAPAAEAVLAAELRLGPPQLKAAAAASLALAAAIAARQARESARRDMMTPEEQNEAGRPLIHVPPPPLPPLEGLVPPPQDGLNTLPGMPNDGPRGPTIETYPDNQPLSIDDLIITRDVDEQRRFRGRVVGEGFRLDPDFKPEWYDAHHILPLNEYADLQGLRDKFAEWNIDLNSLENGVALPNRNGQGSGTPHGDTQSNPEYVDKLLGRFDGVTTREQALERLADIKQELRDGTFIGPKQGKP